MSQLEEVPGKNEFELRIWFFTTVVAALRTLLALVINAFEQQIQVFELLVEGAIFLSFAGLATLIYRRRVNRVHPLIGLAIYVLILVVVIQLGGIGGTTEFNLMVAGMFLVVVTEKKWLNQTVIIFFVLLAIVIADGYFNGPLTRWLYIQHSHTHRNFIFCATGIVVLMIYFRNALIKESVRVEQIKSELADRVGKVEKQKEELEQQRQMLHQANQLLEAEVQEHTRFIQLQNNAIEDYIKLTTEALDEPLRHILANANQLNTADPIDHHLLGSIDELKSVIEDLKSELQP